MTHLLHTTYSRYPASLALVALLVASAACRSADRSTSADVAPKVAPTGQAHEALEPRKITIGNFTFSPATLEVQVGATLVWVNEDDVPHVVVGVDAGSPLRSPALDTDDRYSVVLDRPGTYRYFCSLHPHMTGTVVVK